MINKVKNRKKHLKLEGVKQLGLLRHIKKYLKYLKGNQTALFPPKPKNMSGWIDEFGIYHQKRNYRKMTKHCGGWNNNNGR